MNKILDIKQYNYFFVWLLWDFSGLRFIWEKIRPPFDEKPQGYRPPSTFIFWATGIFSLYIACFGMASQRYENRVDVIEYRANMIITQIAIADANIRKKALSQFPDIQNMWCPPKPDILSFSSIVSSLLSTEGDGNRYFEIIELVKRTVMIWKNKLSGVEFKNIVLDLLILEKAELHGAILSGADLREVTLSEANLQEANLWLANLENADLHRADLKEANLSEANLSEANLSEANLYEAKNLTLEQLSKVRTLYKAKIDPELISQIRRKYPHLLELEKKLK
jgi:uncharacterized protein YjbI with pentapeptide repeats